MDFLLKFRQHFFKKNLALAIPANPSPRKITTIKQAKTIGILFNGTDEKSRRAVLDFATRLSALGKKVRLLGFVNLPDKKVPTDLPFVSFSRAAVNWFGKPASDKADTFCREKFDLLLCLFAGENRPLEWIAARSSAQMKAGNQLAFFKNLDLTVDLATDFSLEKLVSQLEICFSRLVLPVEKRQLEMA